eukprot:TRINITY_DN7991_c0_g1_i1.p1 TRINITY_DN7991_c0_g1~~TRINITY_DN7991_c0_g1_i1.p1  ORF type:complete len:816 (+),score=199.78 TRINITY_DN7991_c0_g1_i1:71-2449(+)
MSAYCPNGHKLATARPEGGESAGRNRKNRKMQCDSCQKIALAHEFAGCRPCNYDICSSCLKKSKSETSVNTSELLGDTFYNKDKKKVGKESLNGKTILVYFWSHTCEICDAFSSALSGYYSEAKEKGCQIEVVAVTDTADDADDEEKEMWKSFETHHGNWLTLPFDDEPGRHRLHDWAGELLGDSPSGCGPSLLVIDDKGMLVNKRALLTVGSGTDYIVSNSWKSPIVGDLSCGPYSNNSDVAMSKAIVVLAEQCSIGVKKKLKETLTEASEELAKQQNPPLLFLGTKSGPCKGVRKDVFKALSNGCETWGRGWTARAIRKWTASADKRCSLPDTRPLMMMIDVSEFTDSERQGFYVSNATLVTVEKILSFVKEVDNEKVELNKFDFSLFEETFEPIPEEVDGTDPKYQPLTGTVTTDGCYMGAGTWEDFGVEGIGGKITLQQNDADGSSCSASSDDEPSPSDNKFSFIDQYRGSDSKKKPAPKPQPTSTNEITITDRVLRLESLVDKQQHIIDQLLTRIKKLEGGTSSGKTYFSLDEQLRQNYREEQEQEQEQGSKDDDSDSNDSLGDAYRARKAAHSNKPLASREYKCEDDDETDSDDSEVRAYRAKKASGATKPLVTREYKCEDDDETDSDDSEVRAYRAKKASQSAKPLVSREYKNEDDDETDPEDDEFRAYSAVKSSHQTNTSGSGGYYKCEDDDETDSDDSEVRAYRAKKAAGAAKPSATTTTTTATDSKEEEKETEPKPSEAPEAKSDPEPSSSAADGINRNEDWVCPKCRGFNWGGTSACAHCA